MVYFREKQTFAPWVYWLILGCTVPVVVPFFTTPPSARLAILLSVVLPTLLTVGATSLLLLLQTEVTDKEIHGALGVGPGLIHKRIPLADITHFEVVTYNALDYGGWGFKGWGSKSTMNARGNQGVLLRLKNGDEVVVGSQQPERLFRALTEARQGTV